MASPITPQKLSADISAGKFAPVYYFFGDEDYRITEAEKYIASQFISNKLLLTNFRKIDGKRTSVGDLLSELSVFPMLGERQMYVVSDIQHYKPTDLDKILKMISPGDKSRLIVLSTPSAKKPKKDAAIIKKLNEIAVLVEFKQMTPDEMGNMIVTRLNKANLKIDRQALKILVELISGNRGAAESEIEKLINYKSSGDTISPEDIQAIAGGYQTYEIWDIGKYVVSKDTKNALRMMRRILAEGNTATSIVYFLARHLISIYLLQNNKPLEPQQRWLAYQYRAQTGLISNQNLEKMIIDTAETDALMRNTRVKPEFLLETLILKMCGEQTGNV